MSGLLWAATSVALGAAALGARAVGGATAYLSGAGGQVASRGLTLAEAAALGQAGADVVKSAKQLADSKTEQPQAEPVVSPTDANPFDPKEDPLEHRFWRTYPEYRDDIREALKRPGTPIPTHEWVLKKPDLTAEAMGRRKGVGFIRRLGLHSLSIRYGRIHLTDDFGTPHLHVDRIDPTEDFWGHMQEVFGLLPAEAP